MCGRVGRRARWLDREQPWPAQKAVGRDCLLGEVRWRCQRWRVQQQTHAACSATPGKIVANGYKQGTIALEVAFWVKAAISSEVILLPRRVSSVCSCSREQV